MAGEWFMEQKPGVVIAHGQVIDDGGALQVNAAALYGTESADHYRSGHAVDYVKPERFGSCVISVLPFLWGRPWDQLALNYVHALRPSAIRVTDGAVTCDARRWRVTVYLAPDGRTIQKLQQEVDVGLVGVECGWGLDHALQQMKPK
jgi:hypothetical protein